MSLREDLELFDIHLPESLSIDQWAASLREKPCQNTLILAGLAAVVFLRAEKDKNPKVNDIWDSLVYCTTCLSVGYGDIFARTPVGKALGSLLMTIGPALSAKALDGPERQQSNNVQLEVRDTLKAILSRLELRPGPEIVE